MTKCVKCPPKTVVAPPAIAVEHIFHPQIVNVIHNVEIIRKHHCVPIPNHIVTFTVKDVFC